MALNIQQVMTNMQAPGVYDRITGFLQATYQYGVMVGRRGVPLKWHQTLPLRGTQIYMNANQDLKTFRAGLITEGKEIAAAIFKKAPSTCTRADVMQLYAFITFIMIEHADTAHSKQGFDYQKIKRDLVTLNPYLMDALTQQSAAYGTIDQNGAAKMLNATNVCAQQVLDARENGSYIYPNIAITSKNVTRHKTVIEFSEPSAYIPSIMIIGYMQGLKDTIGQDTANVYYIKGNDEIRRQAITFNPATVDAIYGNNPYATQEFKDDMLSDNSTLVQPQVITPANWVTPFINNSLQLWKGLWRKAELGHSPLEDTAVRSIPISRIIRVTRASTTPAQFREYTTINFDEAKKYFLDVADNMVATNAPGLQKLLDACIAANIVDNTTTVDNIVPTLQFNLNQGSKFITKLYPVLAKLPTDFPELIARTKINLPEEDEGEQDFALK